MTKQDLLAKVLRFCSRNKISPTRFGIAAANNSALVARLRSPDSSITLATMERVEAFMREYRK